jgi:hypothetical protein
VRLVLLLLALAAGVLLLGRLEWSASPEGLSVRVPAQARPPAKPSADAAPSKTAPQPGEVTVELTESDLNSRLAQRYVGRSIGQTPLGSASLESVRVMLRSGSANLNGAARVGQASVPFTSELAAAAAANGSVRITVSDARVSGVPLPDSARSELEAMIQREVEELIAGQRIRVRSVQIDDGRLRASGSPA